MKTSTLIISVLAASTMMVPLTATAGSSSHAKASCNGAPGNTCPPGAPTEKIVPEYYNVPLKEQHIYYDKPATQTHVTRIVHHVPTPVYGPQVITETIQGGPWMGPALGCCNPAPRVHYQPAPKQTYCYAGSKRRYNHHGHAVKPRSCR